MINWKLTLHKLFFMHEWEDKVTYERHRDYSVLVGALRYMTSVPIVYLRCKICGTLKRKKIKL